MEEKPGGEKKKSLRISLFDYWYSCFSSTMKKKKAKLEKASEQLEKELDIVNLIVKLRRVGLLGHMAAHSESSRDRPNSNQAGVMSSRETKKSLWRNGEDFEGKESCSFSEMDNPEPNKFEHKN